MQYAYFSVWLSLPLFVFSFWAVRMGCPPGQRKTSSAVLVAAVEERMCPPNNLAHSKGNQSPDLSRFCSSSDTQRDWGQCERREEGTQPLLLGASWEWSFSRREVICMEIVKARWRREELEKEQIWVDGEKQTNRWNPRRFSFFCPHSNRKDNCLWGLRARPQDFSCRVTCCVTLGPILQIKQDTEGLNVASSLTWMCKDLAGAGVVIYGFQRSIRLNSIWRIPW